MFLHPSRLYLSLAGVVLIGWAANVNAQTAEPMKLPPLPPATQPAPQADTQPQATALPDVSPALSPNASSNFPPVPLGREDIREVQRQLIALGFDPGPADGEIGPATLAAARRYDDARGRTGPGAIDSALLARLREDTGPRLTPEQVSARAQRREPARAPAPSNPIIGGMQQFDRNLRGLFNGGR